MNGRVYAGNRDGYFYCLDARTGGLVWRFKTVRPSATPPPWTPTTSFYFASEDLHAYALEDFGSSYHQVWKSEKMLGDTFSRYWPVVYRDWVLFSGGAGYFLWPPSGGGRQLPQDEKDAINADMTLPTGSGTWRMGPEHGDHGRVADPGVLREQTAPPPRLHAEP